MSKVETLLFTGGEIHDYKGCGEEILGWLDRDGRFEISCVENDLDIFASRELERYNLIVFYYTVGEITDEQFNGLSRFVKSGKGFTAIHSGADSFRDCPEFRSMVGGWFVTHPHYRSYMVSILDRQSPITEGLEEFTVTDEQYITDYDPRNHILATALWQGKPQPAAWTRQWGKGKIFYLALGHDRPACQNENFGKLLCQGAHWAAERD